MSCQPSPNSLENPSFFRNICFGLTCFELTITSYSMYLLMFHSPVQMKDMTRYLINLACWTRLLDLMYSFFVIPYFFIPTLVVLPVGFFSIIGVPKELQMGFIVVIIAGLGSAVVMIFENRFNAMAPPHFRFKIQRRKAYHLSMFLVNCFLLIFPFLRLDDQSTSKTEFLKILLCPIPEYYTSAFSFKPITVPVLVIAVFLFSTLIGFQVIFFACYSFYFLFSMERGKMSAATRKLQMKFFVTAWLQLLTHLSVIIIPMGYTFFSFLLRYKNQTLVNIAVIIITLHGTITSVSTIAINRPFRMHVRKWLFPKKLKNRRNSVKINVGTVSSGLL